MTIEEAIKHAEEVANNIDMSIECRKEHEQLAGWLKELISLRKKIYCSSNVKRIYSNAC